VDDAVLRLNERLADESASVAEVRDATVTLGDEVAGLSEAIAKDVDEGLGVLETGGAAGAVTLLGGVLLNLYRNSTRRKDLAEVKNGSG
jgi:hypothetical protein